MSNDTERGDAEHVDTGRRPIDLRVEPHPVPETTDMEGAPCRPSTTNRQSGKTCSSPTDDPPAR